MTQMHGATASSQVCSARTVAASPKKERGVRAVVALTASMTVVEIVVGYASGSMALLADGWHMATHVGALGLAAVAYAVSRRFATHPAFAFGTGKVQALAGFTSAIALGLVAVQMAFESVVRLLHPSHVDFASSLPVACVGLLVNVVSVRLLDADEHANHGHQEDHEHGDHREPARGHDHNHRAALTHIIADMVTSALAIAALLAGRFLHISWLDPAVGVIGAVVIVKWGFDLCRGAAFELLGVEPSRELERRIRTLLEGIDDVHVSDLHVWSLGQGQRSCVVTLVSAVPRAVEHYRRQLATLELAHLTVEVQRCAEGHDAALN